MNVHNEELKITIANRLLHRSIGRHPEFGQYNNRDTALHNLRAHLINRVERESGYDLKVLLDGRDPNAVAKIVDRKTYLAERGIRYGD